MYKLNFGSEIQSLTGQDIEIKEFETYSDLYDYATDRMSSNHYDCTYVAFFDGILAFDSNEFPHGFICRHYSQLFKFIKSPLFTMPAIGLTLNVFEFSSYEDALKYLQGYFESSSKMYNNE